MSRLKYLTLIGMALCLSAPAFAQTGPDDITVPDGHRLVEFPAEFKIATKPIIRPTLESYIVVPGIYKHFTENGIRRRQIVQAPIRGERLVAGPLRTETVKVITYPKSYILEDQNGRIVKRFRWVKGKLKEV